MIKVTAILKIVNNRRRFNWTSFGRRRFAKRAENQYFAGFSALL